MARKIPKRVSTALINSLGAGVVPRIGLEHIVVGREQEIATLLQDLEDIAEGGATFRFVVGGYSSGKSFLLQLMRNYAMERSFVVADANLSAERRLAGADGQGIATYRELMRNIATKTHPHGGALALILERWISSIQAQVVQATGILPQDTGFDNHVESRILAAVKQIEGLVHEFAFVTVVTTYWRGYRLDDGVKKNAALRWLQGFATKTEVDSALGVQDIIDDDSWYDYIKLFARIVSDIGYKGLLVVLDEAVYLYRIDEAKSVAPSGSQRFEFVDYYTASRQNNYDKLLTMFNDTMQGRAKSLGIYVGGTSEFLEDPKRGLFTDQAWQRRIAKSRSTQSLLDPSKLVVQLEALRTPEILMLLQRLADIHAIHFDYESSVTTSELHEFVKEFETRLGAEALLMPGKIVQNFVSILNILQQNPKTSLGELIHGTDFSLTP